MRIIIDIKNTGALTSNEIGNFIKENIQEELDLESDYYVEDENEIDNFDEWLKYLDNLNDKTGFNNNVASVALRVLQNYAVKYGSYEEASKYFNDIKKETKETVCYFPDFKYYFKCKTKKDMENVDLSIYKFE